MPFDDVRMRGFQSRSSVAETLDWIDRQACPLPAEWVPIMEAAGRVLAEPATSPRDVPAFRRAMMDGYALIAADTVGASSGNPLSLRITGQVLPGNALPGRVDRGQAVRIMTGAPIPDGADAVLPAERCRTRNASNVEVLDEVRAGKHVGEIGEDVRRDDVVLPLGRRLRPQDVGVLSSVGYTQVPVFRKPRVRLVVTGDELCAAGSLPDTHQIIDSNGPMLAALIQRDGGELAFGGPMPDCPDAIASALRADADVVVVTGGSSVGVEDHAPRLLAELGHLDIHGVAMRPSGPSGMGRFEHRLVFLLPGNPVSCLCAYDFFAGRAIRRQGGRSILDHRDWPYSVITGSLAQELSSTVGRVDYARVSVDGAQVEPIAISGASRLSSTTRADGFVIIPAESERLPIGTAVTVFLYDPAV